MAKPKSAKLRTLIALHALYKYTDKEHRMNSLQLNEYLRPYGLECSNVFLSNLVHAMQEYGIDVYQSGSFEKRGVFVQNRPLSEQELQKLIFAVATNPHLSQEQATEILQSLKPFVTVYQEHLLHGVVETDPIMVSEELYQTYTIIQEAISSDRRIVFRVDRLKYNKTNQTAEKVQRIKMRFTPRYLFQTKAKLYMVGYNSTKQVFEAVDLNDITYISLAMQHTDPFKAYIDQYFSTTDPQELLPESKRTVIYEGNATFQCYGLYDMDLFRRFGAPAAPVIRDNRCRVTYHVSHVSITSDDLNWLSQIPGYGIRIVGPELLVEAVREYYTAAVTGLLDPVVPREYRKLYLG